MEPSEPRVDAKNFFVMQSCWQAAYASVSSGEPSYIPKVRHKNTVLRLLLITYTLNACHGALGGVVHHLLSRSSGTKALSNLGTISTSILDAGGLLLGVAGIRSGGLGNGDRSEGGEEDSGELHLD